MDSLVSTDPSLLNVDMSDSLRESASVSTFLPEEEASICPLLGSTTPLTFSHPLTPSADNDSNASTNICNDGKGELGSSTSSSSGSGINVVADSSATALFGKHNYQHLQANSNGNAPSQEHNGHAPNGNIALNEDTPSFVAWNWPLIRKCTFFVFMSSLLAMCSIVVAMIVTLPKTCNPNTAWYRGSVFYEIFPASFQDSNNDGIGDLLGIASRTNYLAALGVSAVRLNSIFTTRHYPEDYDHALSIEDVSPILGGSNALHQLVGALHERNISLILDLPVTGFLQEIASDHDIAEDASTANMSDTKPVRHNAVRKAIQKWLTFGVDGFYIKGLENIEEITLIEQYLFEWKQLIGKNRIIIINRSVLSKLQQSEIDAVLANVDLVDVFLDVTNGTENIENQVRAELNGYLNPEVVEAWIHWSIGGIDHDRLTKHTTQSRKITLAATLMQLMLPGTPSIFYGDEIGIESVLNPNNEHNETIHLHHLPTMHWFNSTMAFTNRATIPWLPPAANYNVEHLQIVADMIELRDRSPSIYKNSICKVETTLPNTQIRHSHDDILVLERIYPRRNTFVSVSNFGWKKVTVDMTSMYYSGISMVGATRKNRIYFKNLDLEPFETIIVKLDK